MDKLTPSPATWSGRRRAGSGRTHALPRRRLGRRLAGALLLACAALAWTGPQARLAAQGAGAPAPTPLEKDLGRLAEIMGSLAWLRQLCGAGDARLWRERMQALIDSETALPARRDLLVNAYNAGFGAYGRTYRRCTPSAGVVIDRFVKEGEALARKLSVHAAR